MRWIRMNNECVVYKLGRCPPGYFTRTKSCRYIGLGDEWTDPWYSVLNQTQSQVAYHLDLRVNKGPVSHQRSVKLPVIQSMKELRERWCVIAWWMFKQSTFPSDEAVWQLVIGRIGRESGSNSSFSGSGGLVRRCVVCLAGSRETGTHFLLYGKAQSGYPSCNFVYINRTCTVRKWVSVN